MSQNNTDVQLGKFLSLILRHKPETVGITLDENGWAYVDALLRGINQTGRKIDQATLERIVAQNNKKRYTFSNDKQKIRANQGHSLAVDVELKKITPPEYLYHGTASRFLDSIMKQGILKGTRQHVHLSCDLETATAVGKRHGKPVILKVFSGQMHASGHPFYCSENGVWLVDAVPVGCFILVQTP